MGKAQSKRSVDITTENKKGPEDTEVTGELKKIEDVDQKPVNGDATPQETNEAEEKKIDETENDKDLTTEKSAENAQTNGESGEQNTTDTTMAAESPKDDSKDAAATTPKEGSGAEEISPLADESMKKAKKEKVKKKWSFRSISFGKKDKQKPAKTEETNGEPEKAAAEGVTEASKGEEVGAGGDAGEATAAEQLENGDATEKELNGQKTPTPTDEQQPKTDEAVAQEETNATAVTIAAAVTVAATPTATAGSSVSNETAMETQTEKVDVTVTVAAAAATTETIETAAAAIVSNGTAAEVEKNGLVETPVEVGMAEAEAVVNNVITAENKTIPNNEGCAAAEEKVAAAHQNGVAAADEAEAEQQQTKSQIEVKTNNNISTNITTSAANLAYSSSTSTSSYETNVQTINNDIIDNGNNADYSNGEVAKQVVKELLESVHEIETLKVPEIATIDFNVENENAIKDTKIKTTQLEVETDEKFSETLSTPTDSIERDFEIVKIDDAPNADDGSDVGTAKVINSQPAISTVTNESQQPPPLPISPPPSQVSVFAFSDNSEIPDTLPAALAADMLTEINEQSTAVVVPDIELEVEIKELADEMKAVCIDESLRTDANVDVDVETNPIQAEESGELIKENKIILATAIVDEITEQAVELVQQKQLEQEQEQELKQEKPIEVDNDQDMIEASIEAKQIENLENVSKETAKTENQFKSTDYMGQMEQEEEQRQKREEEVESEEKKTVTEEMYVLPEQTLDTDATTPIETHYTTTFPTNLEIVTEEEALSSAILKEINDIVASVDDGNCLTTPSSAAINLALESENQDCSYSKSNSSIPELLVVGHATSKEPHIDSSSLLIMDNEEDTSAISTINKEIASAKDLKENAAAEIKTQDLPVTSE